jgi:hypothetical protein
MELAQLLYRAESESLDFKRDQYHFVGGDERPKSELLKDILAMANSWRSEPARILIGIDASVTPPQVVGITEHLDDAMLQQFVHGKTQRPLKFSYYVTELKGRSVGVIDIPVQARPIYLRKDFGKLGANKVYFRRGSSTGEASPDEIAEMGAANSNLKEGDLQVGFAKPEGRELTGSTFAFESIVCRLTDKKIPDFKPREAADPFRISSIITKRPNRNFYRELVAGVQQVHLLQQTAMTVTNAGSVAAKEIRVEFVLPDAARNWEFCEESDFPTNFPKRYQELFMMTADKFRPAHRSGEPDYEFNYIDGTWHLTFEFGHLQPGRTLWPALKCYVGARKSGSVTLTGRVMADGLAAAAACRLELAAEVSESEASLEDLLKRFEELDESDEH